MGINYFTITTKSYRKDFKSYRPLKDLLRCSTTCAELQRPTKRDEWNLSKPHLDFLGWCSTERSGGGWPAQKGLQTGNISAKSMCSRMLLRLLSVSASSPFNMIKRSEYCPLLLQTKTKQQVPPSVEDMFLQYSLVHKNSSLLHPYVWWCKSGACISLVEADSWPLPWEHILPFKVTPSKPCLFLLKFRWSLHIEDFNVDVRNAVGRYCTY